MLISDIVSDKQTSPSVSNQYPSNNRSKSLIVMDGELGKFDTIPPSSLKLSVSMDDVAKNSPRRFLVSEC